MKGQLDAAIAEGGMLLSLFRQRLYAVTNKADQDRT